VFATSVIGGVSAAACIAIVISIVVHGRVSASLRDRITIGLMMANALYSCANTIPINSLSTSDSHCGLFALSITNIRIGRTIWMGGKFALVGFEIFIMTASIRALFSAQGRVVSKWTECALHLFCGGLGGIAAATFWMQSSDISQNGYNTTTRLVAADRSYANLNFDDDVDDVGDRSGVAVEQFVDGR
jgi:hypothetical protein